MTYSILPLTPTWTDSFTETAEISSTQYGPTGVELREFKGITPSLVGWDIQVAVVNFAAIDTFLRGLRGSPFYLSLDGGATTDGNLYICQQWSIERQGPTAAIFSAKFNQILRYQ